MADILQQVQKVLEWKKHDLKLHDKINKNKGNLEVVWWVEDTFKSDKLNPGM